MKDAFEQFPNRPLFKFDRAAESTEPLVTACLDAAEVAGVERPVAIQWILNPLVQRPQRAVWGHLS